MSRHSRFCPRATRRRVDVPNGLRRLSLNIFAAILEQPPFIEDRGGFLKTAGTICTEEECGSYNLLHLPSVSSLHFLSPPPCRIQKRGGLWPGQVCLFLKKPHKCNKGHIGQKPKHKETIKWFSFQKNS